MGFRSRTLVNDPGITEGRFVRGVRDNRPEGDNIRGGTVPIHSTWEIIPQGDVASLVKGHAGAPDQM
jgi:hypothetical protein